MTPGNNTESGRTMSAASPISLADFHFLRVRVHWAEAVAIVEDLCALLAGSGQNGGIPDLRDIAITSHGTVMIRQGAEVSSEIDDIGRTLHALLETDATPMPLRLFVAESIGSGKYTSVAAYAEALAYYARPGRRSLIQALYTRCLEPSEVAQDPLPKPAEAARPVTKPPRRRLSVAAVVAMAIVLLGAAAATAWVWRDDPRLAGSVTAVRSVASAAVSAVRQIASDVEPGTVEKPDGSKKPGSTKPGSRSPRAATGSPRTAADLTVDASALLKSVGVDPAAAATAPASASAADVAQALVVDGSAGVPPLLAAPTVGTVDASAVYASGAEGVQPPVMYHPKLPPVAPIDPKIGGTNTMQLLIDEGGNVEQVKLVSEPVRMSDMLLLSSAKTWRFHPALKDGKPVKFQLSVSWTVSPP
jgi:outer membrane biosynthesis protein TonB